MRVSERLKGVVLTYVFMLLRNVAAILIIPYIISHVGVSTYGVYSLVATIIGYLVIVELGLSNTTVRFLSKYLVQQDRESEGVFLGKIFLLYVLVTGLAVVLAAFFYGLIERVFEASLNGSEIELLKVLYIVLVINIAITLLANSLTGIIVSRERFGFVKSLDIATFLVRTVLVVVVLHLGYGVIEIAVIDTVANGVGGLAKLFYVVRHIKPSVRFSWNARLFREILNYGFYVSLNVVVNQVNWRLAVFILGIVAGAQAVAIYSVGLQFVLAYIAIAAAITNVFLPKFVALVEREASSSDLTAEMRRIGRYQFIMLGLFIVCYASFGMEFIRLVFGSGFDLAYYSSLVLMGPMTLVLIQGAANCILQAKNLQRFKSILLIGVAFFNVILSFFLANAYGIMGVAFGTALSIALGELVLMGFYLHRYVKLDMVAFYVGNFSIMFVIVGLIIAFKLFAPMVSEWVDFLAAVCVISMVYLSFVWIFVLEVADRALFGMLIKKVVRRS